MSTRDVETLQADAAMVQRLFEWGRRLVDAAATEPAPFNESAERRLAAQVELVETLLATLRESTGREPVRGGLAKQEQSRIVEIAEDYALAHVERAQPEAVLALPDDVELRQQVQPVGDHGTLVEVAVAAVGVRVREDGRVLGLGAHAQVVADRIVPAHLQVVPAGVDVERVRGAAGPDHRRAQEGVPEQAARRAARDGLSLMCHRAAP